MDPITLEIINSSLAAYADEMTNSFWRSSYSYMNYEVRDFAVGFIDREGRIITQSRYTHPAFTGDLGYVVKAAVDDIGESNISQGDIIVTNDPVVQGQHLNNTVVFAPLICDGRIFAYSCVRAHLHDVGGATVGSGGPGATEIFQEGLQISASRLYRKGVANEELYRLIERNTRFPEIVRGDLNAQVAASKLGLRRFLELIEKFGRATIEKAVMASWDMAERAARKAVSAIPSGRYYAESFLDNDGIDLEKPVPIRVHVEIKGEEMTIDFSDISDQVKGAMNSGYYGGATNVGRIVFKCLTTPRLPSNEGCFRPLTIICPEGKILNARRPAALYEWSVTFPTIIDTTLKALSNALVSRVPAATRGDPRGAWISGFNEATRKYFTINIPHPGGHGARPTADAPSPKCSIQQGNEHGLPIEIVETKNPVIFERYALREDSGGAGRYRGGLGTDVMAYLELDCDVRNQMSRSKCPPWGLDGGGNGATNIAFTVDKGRESPLLRTKIHRLASGERVRVLTGGGGGHGDPFDRPADKVRDDAVDGYISIAAARDCYGVVMNQKFEIDEQATATSRNKRGEAAQ